MTTYTTFFSDEEYAQITFEYCEDFTNDGKDDVRITIDLLAPGSGDSTNSGTEDIRGVVFDLNSTAGLVISDIERSTYQGTLSDATATWDIQSGGVSDNNNPEASYEPNETNGDGPVHPGFSTSGSGTQEPYDAVVYTSDQGTGEGIVQKFSFVISGADDIDAPALLNGTDWWIRVQSTDGGGGSAKVAGTVVELPPCEDEPEEEHDPGSAMTPGFWKNHAAIFLQETGHALGDSWEGVFGVEVMAEITAGGGRTKVVTLDPTLGNALNANGGGEAALLRASTAAWANASSDDLNYSYANGKADPADTYGTLETGIIEAFGLVDDPTTTDDDAAFAAALADAFDFVVGIAETIDLNDDLLLSTAEIINAVQDVYDDPDATTDFFSWSDVGDVAKALDAMNNMPHIDAGDFA